MNIAFFVDPFGEKSPGGLGRSIHEITKAILAADTKNTYTIYLKHKPASRPTFPGNHWTLKILNLRNLWLTGAWRIKRNFDLYIFSTPVIPLFLHPKKSIVVAYDFAYLEIPAKGLRDRLSARILYLAHKRSFRIATCIVAISADTAQKVSRYFGINQEKVVTIPIGYIAVSEKKEPMPTPERFFLFAGVLKERKNVAGIIRAFAEFCTNNPTLDYSLLIAGNGGGVYGSMLHELVRTLNLEKRVQFLGYVSNEQLAFLYSKAIALIFPSLIEGFGMPVLEAMSVGLPVITSNSGALAEVAGGAALLVDPHNPTDIAHAMEQLTSSNALREQLQVKGYIRAKEFTWEGFGKIFLQIVHKSS